MCQILLNSYRFKIPFGAQRKDQNRAPRSKSPLSWSSVINRKQLLEFLIKIFEIDRAARRTHVVRDNLLGTHVIG